MISKNKVFNTLLRKNFLGFLYKSFLTLNPTSTFLLNWHIKLVSDYLTLVEQNKINRLIINIPPRSLKSTCISVAWPAWLLGQDPCRKIIVSSYSMQLSIKHSIDTRTIMESDWYKQIFPNTQISKKCNNKKKFLTHNNGFRMATSVGGSITGEGADILIVDDPHNPTYLDSAKIRKKTTHWYENTLATRLNNPKTGAIIIIMQRLHQDDLCGNIIKKKLSNWDIVSIPAIATTNMCYTTPLNTQYLFKANTSIHQNQLPIEYLIQLRNEIGEHAFSCQYQQKPLSKSKGFLQSKQMRYYQTLPKNFKLIVQSWDTAFKTNNKNDFSACTTWGITSDNDFFLIDAWCAKLEYCDLKQKVQDLAKSFKADILLIEDHASGQSIIQELMNIAKPYMVKPIHHKISKFARFAKAITYIVSEKTFFPKHNPIVEQKLIPELTNFPYHEHDDMVDSLSQFFNYAAGVNERKFSIRAT